MDNTILVKFTSNSGGSEFQLKNIEHYSWSVTRQPSANGRVGTTAHEIGLVQIQRKKSLEEKGLAGLEGEMIKLASQTAKKAYFKGEITLARADDPSNVIQTIRWDEGHVCGLSCQAYGSQITETIDICATQLMVDDSTFKRVNTE